MPGFHLPARLRRVRLHPAVLQEPTDIRAELERLLVSGMLPFWESTIDRAHGGFALNHDVRGRWRGPSPKRLVTQARTTWFFAELARSPYGTPLHAELAAHGFAFLRERMWDSENGGFAWEVDHAGAKVRDSRKHLYGQAFGLFALAGHLRLTSDSTAREMAETLFANIERAAEAAPGGFNEALDEAWRTDARRRTPLGTPTTARTLNTHIHLLEAFLAYAPVAAYPAPVVRQVSGLTRLISQVATNSGFAPPDQFGADWAPRGLRTSYGHIVQAAWFLLDSLPCLAEAERPAVRDAARELFGTAARYGFDHEHGGFYESGLPGPLADRKGKVWWVQAEGLVAALALHGLTGDDLYAGYFEHTARWVLTHQADEAAGDWHARVIGQQWAEGAKAGPWKGPYHHGRALLRCLELLSDPLAATASSGRAEE